MDEQLRGAELFYCTPEQLEQLKADPNWEWIKPQVATVPPLPNARWDRFTVTPASVPRMNRAARRKMRAK